MYPMLTDKWKYSSPKIIIIIFILAVTVSVFPTLYVYAGVNPLQISIDTGFDGKCKQGGINPVVVTVHAQSQAFNGILKLSSEGKIFTCPVQLQQGAKKSFGFEVPLFYPDTIFQAELYEEDTCIAKEECTPEILPESSIYIGILSDTPENFYYYKDISSEFFEGRKILPIAMNRDFPYSMDELENFNLVVLENFDTETLSSEAQGTLQDWISSGNVMMVGAGKYSYRTLTGMFTGLKDTKSMGKGKIVPVSEGLDSLTLSQVGSIVNKNMTSYSVSKIFGYNTLKDRISDENLLSAVAHDFLQPSKRTAYFVLSLLFVYVLIVTFTFFGKGKIRVVFTIVIFATGVLLPFFIYLTFNGVNVSATVIKMYDEKVKSYSLTVINSHDSEKLEAGWEKGYFTYTNSLENYETDVNGNRLLLTGEKDVPINIYSHSSETANMHKNSLNIGADGVVYGEVKNPLPYTLRNCFLMVGDCVINIGNMDGKEKVAVKYKLEHSLRGMGDYNYLEALNNSIEAESSIRQMIEYSFYHLDGFGQGVKLIGFCEGEQQIEINEKTREITSVVMNIFDVNVIYEDGAVEIPSGIIRPIIMKQNDTKEKERLECLTENQKETTVCYVLPSFIKASNVKFYCSDLDSGKSIEVFNHANQAWELLKGDSISEQKLEQCISAGPLLVRLKGEGRRMVPQVSVNGEVLAQPR